MARGMVMKIVCLYTDKGGVSKTTTSPNIAAGLKNAFPESKVGLMDLCSDHGHLSKRYASSKEQALVGAWGIVEALTDPRLLHDKENAEKAVRACVTPLRVVPGTKGQAGCISFINVGVGLSHNLRGARVFGSNESARGLGEDFAKVIERVLGLDYLVVDLPGAVDEAMVRSVLPLCYAVTIPMDVRCYMNMAEAEVLVAKLRGWDVAVSGFLRTFVDESPVPPAAQDVADEMLGALSGKTQIRILKGGIPNLPTLPSSIEPSMGEDGVAEAGLYVYGARKGLNGNQRGVIKRTALAVEGALSAMLAEADAHAASK